MSLTFLHRSLMIRDQVKMRVALVSDLWWGKLGKSERALCAQWPQITRFYAHLTSSSAMRHIDLHKTNHLPKLALFLISVWDETQKKNKDSKLPRKKSSEQKSCCCYLLTLRNVSREFRAGDCSDHWPLSVTQAIMAKLNSQKAEKWIILIIACKPIIY